MKPYKVVQPFKNLDGAPLRVGDTIQCDDSRAAVLRRYGKISGVVETAEKKFPQSIETAVEAPVETAVEPEKKTEKRGKRW